MQSTHTVFIVPYRDRQTQLDKFKNYFRKLTELSGKWGNGLRLLVVEQSAGLPFNRGAMKNIGAIEAAKAYGKDITLVFHDVDTMPRYPLSIDFSCRPGEVNHIYGNSSSLGGIIAIRASDFVRSGGFANIWGWGYEDNVLTSRVMKAGIVINREAKIPLTDLASMIRLDATPGNIKRAISVVDLQRVARGLCDCIRNINYSSSLPESDTLLVTSFTTRFSPPPNLVSIGPEVLRGNVLRWATGKGANRRMLYSSHN